MITIALSYSHASMAAEVLEDEQIRQMDKYAGVKIRALDKVTARAITLDLDIGETVEFGSLFIRAQTCRKAPPVEAPESAAFIEIWEHPINKNRRQDEPKWVYSGWMFASSPGLASMDHPIYDIWALDCIGEPLEEESPIEKIIDDVIPTELLGDN